MTTPVGKGLASFTWLYDSSVPFPKDGNKRVLDYTRSQLQGDFVGYVKNLFIEFSTETNPLLFRNFCAIQFKNVFYSKDRIKVLYSQQKWRNLPEDVKDIIRKKLMEMACNCNGQLTLIHKNVALLMSVIAAIDFPSNIFFGTYTASDFIQTIPQNMSLSILNEIFEYVKNYNWITDIFITKALDITVSGLKTSDVSNVSNWLGGIENLVRFANLDHTLIILDFLLKIDKNRMDSDALKALFSIFTAAVDRDIPSNTGAITLPPNALDAIISVATTTVVSAASSLDNDDTKGVIQAILDLFSVLAYRGDDILENNVFCKRFISDIFPAYETIGYAAFNLLNKRSFDSSDDDAEDIIELLNTISESLSNVVRDVVNKYLDITQCSGGNGPCSCVVCNILNPLFLHVVKIASSDLSKACVAMETLRVLAENNIPKFNIILVQETNLDSTLFTIAQEAPRGSPRDLFLRLISSMDANYFYLSQCTPEQASKLDNFLKSFLIWLRDSPAALLISFCSCASSVVSGFVQIAESGSSTAVSASVLNSVISFANNTFDIITNTLASLSLPSVAAYRACSELVSTLLYDYHPKLTNATSFCASLCKMLTNVVAQKPATIGSVPTEVVIPYFVDIMNEYIPNLQMDDAFKCLSIYVDLCNVGWFSQSVARGLAAFRQTLNTALTASSSSSLSAAVPQVVQRIVQVLIPYVSVNEKVECSSALDVIAAYINVGSFNAFISPEIPQLVTLLHTKVIPFAWHLVKPAAINLLGSILYSNGTVSACPQQIQSDVYTILVKNISELAHLSVQDKNNDDDIDYVQDTRFTVLDVLNKLLTYVKTANGGCILQPQQQHQLVSIALDAITYYFNDWEFTSNKAIVLIYDLCTVIFSGFGDIFKGIVSVEQSLIQNVNDVIRGFDTSNVDIIKAKACAMDAYLKL